MAVVKKKRMKQLPLFEEPGPRPHQFNMRLNDEETARLHRLADFYGLSVPDVTRMLAKREADALAKETRERKT